VNNVKNNNLKNSLLAVLVLSSSAVCAEEQYPATNFQPTIVYQDEAYIAKSGQAATSANTEAAKPQASAADDKYPAANFQPEVVYSDPNYKHGSGSIGSSSASSSGASSSVASDDKATSTEAKASDSTMNYLIGLIVMALGGVAFFRASKCPKCKKAVASTQTQSGGTGTPGGLTGVAKYLNKTSGTGVSRYVEKQINSVRAGAAHAATGVEKYIRNRR
jgi:hypothetical protein